MEIQPILNTIKDLTERSQSIRGILTTIKSMTA